MLKLIRLVIKSLPFVLAIAVSLSLFPSLEGVFSPVSGVTGLIELYNKAEKSALSLLPDSIESFIKTLSLRLADVGTQG